MYVLTIDPGVRALGVCLWKFRNWKDKTVPPIKAAIFKSDREEWHEAIADLLSQLSKWTAGKYVRELHTELPILFSGGKGYASAAGGDLVNLAASVGALVHWCSVRDVEFHPYRVGEWNGQLKKEEIHRRIRKAGFHLNLSKEKKTLSANHDWDACGIGMYAKGHSYFNL